MSAPTTEQLLIRRSLQKRLGREIADCATEQLVRGLDTPHLRQLAGVSGTEGPGELEDLFDRTSRELGLEMPSPEAAIGLYAQGLARDYLWGRLRRRSSSTSFASFASTPIIGAIYIVLSATIRTRGSSGGFVFSSPARCHTREF